MGSFKRVGWRAKQIGSELTAAENHRLRAAGLTANNLASPPPTPSTSAYLSLLQSIPLSIYLSIHASISLSLALFPIIHTGTLTSPHIFESSCR